MDADRNLTIIGGGLAGALLATLLAQRGWSVDVYEKRGDPRVHGYAGGRSINLAVDEAGVVADRVGVAGQVGLAFHTPHHFTQRRAVLNAGRQPGIVHVGHHRVGDDLLPCILLVDHRLLGNEDGHRRPLGVVVLAGHVQDVGADDLRHIREDLGQTVGVVLLVDVLDIPAALILGRGVAHVVDVEAQRLGEVVEALQPQARQGFYHGGGPSLGGIG